MVRVRFESADGETARDAEGAVGETLLTIGQCADQPLEGTCEGQMACSTCHVHIAPDWFDRLPQASDNEEDMLDLAASATRYSRLACQIILTAELDGLVVRIPPESRNMQGR